MWKNPKPWRKLSHVERVKWLAEFVVGMIYRGSIVWEHYEVHSWRSVMIDNEEPVTPNPMMWDPFLHDNDASLVFRSAWKNNPDQFVLCLYRITTGLGTTPAESLSFDAVKKMIGASREQICEAAFLSYGSMAESNCQVMDSAEQQNDTK